MGIDKFIDIVRNWDREQKQEYMEACVGNIKAHKA